MSDNVPLQIDPVQLIQQYKDNKIDAVKYVNQVTKLGVKESKRIVDEIYNQNYDAIIEKQNEEISVWNPTKVVDRYLQVDDVNKKWATVIGVFKPKVSKIYKYEDILEFELLEDGDTITKGGLGRAVAGGVLFGGVGAVVGGATGKRTSKKVVKSMSIKITLKSMNEPVVYINFITAKTKTSSLLYKTAANYAQETLSILAQIVAQNEEVEGRDQTAGLAESISAADAIRKYKELLDDGIIDQEEFDAKKKELLGL